MTPAERAELVELRERGDRFDAELRALYRTMERICEAAGIAVDAAGHPSLDLLPGGLVDRIDAITDVIVTAYRAEGMPLPVALGGEPEQVRPDLRVVHGGES
jgi:hypothetical protein